LATAVNGGNTPLFQWLLNGQPVSNQGSVYSSNQFGDGDVIQCVLTSSKDCVATNPVFSNELTVEVLPVVTPVLSLTASEDSTFCLGTAVTFTVEVENAGQPDSIQWFWNNLPIPGNSGLLTISNLEDGDWISCAGYFSAPCIESPVSSNVVTLSVDSCAVNTLEISERGLLVYPNPADEKIFIENMSITSTFALRLLNLSGQILLNTSIEHSLPSSIELNVSLFPKGIYLLEVSGPQFTTVKKIVLQ
jgi:hypothetical protein